MVLHDICKIWESAPRNARTEAEELRRRCNPDTLGVRTLTEKAAQLLATAPYNSQDPAADLELMRRLARGDESALESLYDRYGGVVYSVAMRVVKDAAIAEEILQDVFYHLWRRASDYDPSRGGLGAWLFVSARNRAIDRLRQRKPADSLNIDVGAPSHFNLESRAAQAELMSRIQSVIETLPASQRQALELAYFDGMTHSEIAQRTGEPLGTVKTRLRSALQALRQALNP